MKKSVKTLSVLLAAVFLFSFAAPLTVGAKDLYSDVEAGRWSEGSIEYASENGYMQGVGGGRFDPEGSMTRAMVVTVLWRIDGRPAAGKSSFSDVPDGEWYSEPVAWAESTGVVTGVGGGRFDPDGVSSREGNAHVPVWDHEIRLRALDGEPDVGYARALRQRAAECLRSGGGAGLYACGLIDHMIRKERVL